MADLEVEGPAEGRAEGGPGDVSGEGGVRFYPDFLLTYLSDTVMQAGEVRALKWLITRTDGMQSDAPASISITLTDSAFVPIAQAFPIVQIDPNPPALSVIAEGLLTVPASGLYWAVLVATDIDGETRVDRQLIVVP